MATPSDDELFVWSEVLELVDNDKEMAMMMLQNFLESERESFNTVVLQGSKAEPDWPVLRSSAHSLKGSSSYLCLKIVSALCYDMQHAAEAKFIISPYIVNMNIAHERFQDKSKVDQILPKLTVAFERSFQLLTAKNEELSSA